MNESVLLAGPLIGSILSYTYYVLSLILIGSWAVPLDTTDCFIDCFA